MVKKLLLTVASVFLLWQSLKLTGSLLHLRPDGVLGLLFLAWVINMFITGVVAFAGFAWPTQRLLPETYYHIHRPARLMRVYRLLGVGLFRRMLLATLWSSAAQRARYFDGRRGGMNRLDVQSRKSEFGHLLPLIAITGVAGYLLLHGRYRLAILTLIVNVAGNFYPILLQRYHRLRIARLRARFPRG
ncbi:hypothetical protein [Lewinella sp. IMCC34183]|uniref:glycosyl-4,4'-diaponeurosporenoate acyltransferase CrtO family protein n=1 Tax=Lewinella sp. IMCC34183 TaxID=2248762 RepID=UPI001300B594|nr:hypothetical protein [Lewinella sp. IMCC34183]